MPIVALVALGVGGQIAVDSVSHHGSLGSFPVFFWNMECCYKDSVVSIDIQAEDSGLCWQWSTGL